MRTENLARISPLAARLNRAMKVRSAMRRETASPAVREEAERRKQAITGARNVLREGLRNAPLL